MNQVNGSIGFSTWNRRNSQKTFKKTGFTDIDSKRFDMTLYFDSEEEAVNAAFFGGAVALAYRKFDEQTKEEVHGEYPESIGPYRNETGFDIPGEFVMVTGHKDG